MITLICCLLIAFMSGFLFVRNLMQEQYESQSDFTDYRNTLSVMSSQDNTFSLISLVLLLFVSSNKSTNSFSQE